HVRPLAAVYDWTGRGAWLCARNMAAATAVVEKRLRAALLAEHYLAALAGHARGAARTGDWWLAIPQRATRCAVAHRYGAGVPRPLHRRVAAAASAVAGDHRLVAARRKRAPGAEEWLDSHPARPGPRAAPPTRSFCWLRPGTRSASHSPSCG